MKIFNLIVVGLTMLLAANCVPANADDVIVRHRTKDGKPENLVVDHTQLPDVQKAMRQSKSLDSFKISTDTKEASMLKSPLRDPAGSQDPEEPEGFAVRFAVEDEEAPEGCIYEPWKVYVCKGDGAYGRDYYNYAYYPNEYMIEEGYEWGCYVPEGEYTIILSSVMYEVDENKDITELISYLYIVEENVKIDGDTTITFRQSDAKNRITASCLFPNGTDVLPDPFIYDENGEIIGVMGNIDCNLCRSIININGDYCLNFISYGIVKDIVYVNDLSENWIYVANMSVIDEKGAYTNCVTHSGPITSNLHIQNDPNGYDLMHVHFNSELPGLNSDVRDIGITSEIAWKGADWNIGTTSFLPDHLGITDDFPLFINSTPSDLTSPDSFDLIVVPIVATDRVKIIEDWDDKEYSYYEYVTASGPGIYYTTQGNYMCIDSYGYYNGEYPEESFLLPYDELFSFEKTSQTVFLSDAPILSAYAYSYISDWYSSFGIWPLFRYPCLSSYSLPYSLSAKYNGTILAENEPVESFDWEEWSYENYKEQGVFDVVLSAMWKTDDPKAIVSNTVHIDTRNEDYFVPQVVRWQLRNKDCSIGDIATSNSKIYLMCQEDDDTEFSISASIAEIDDYDLNIKMIRDELFYEYGQNLIRRFYEVSLEDFPGIKGNKYSLEFNLSDASGNTSKQTIGNAFEWGTTTGINDIDKGKEIYFENGILHAPANAEVFTIEGHRANRTSLTSGLYLVKFENKTTKVLVP